VPKVTRLHYDLAALAKPQILGRSHRSKVRKARLCLAIDLTEKILGVPADYLIGIVPASGAYEMAMWSMLGQRPVDLGYWESFGKGWFSDAMSRLKLQDVHKVTAGYGKLPDLTQTKI
jgi:phosphoserine aminotransferase